MKERAERIKAIARAKVKAEKAKRFESFKMPRVGDLLWHIPTGLLAYCDGKSDDGHTLMSFPGEKTSHEYTKKALVNNFKY